MKTFTKQKLLQGKKSDGGWKCLWKTQKTTGKVKSIWDDSAVRTEAGTKELRKIISKSSCSVSKACLNLLKE